jgi:hypothetical protein
MGPPTVVQAFPPACIGNCGTYLGARHGGAGRPIAVEPARRPGYGPGYGPARAGYDNRGGRPARELPRGRAQGAVRGGGHRGRF